MQRQKIKTEQGEPNSSTEQQGGLLKELKKKIDIRNSKAEVGKDISPCNGNDINKPEATKQELERQDEEKEIIWKKLLSDAAYTRLKESKTDLHLKVHHF